METQILWLQAQALRWTAFAILSMGLYLGIDPLTAAWRAALAALIAMVVIGWLARRVALVMQERIAADMAEREMAKEKDVIIFDMLLLLLIVVNFLKRRNNLFEQTCRLKYMDIFCNHFHVQDI